MGTTDIKSLLQSKDFKTSLRTFIEKGAYFTKGGNYNTLISFVPKENKEKTFGFSFPDEHYDWKEEDFSSAIELFISLLEKNEKLAEYIKNIYDGNIKSYSNGDEIFKVIATKFGIKKGTYTNNKTGEQQTQRWPQAIDTVLREDTTLNIPVAVKGSPKYCAGYYNRAIKVANSIHKSESIDESFKKAINDFLLNTYVGLCFILNKIKQATPQSPASSNSSSNSNISEGSKGEQDNKQEVPTEDKRTQKITTAQSPTNADVPEPSQSEGNLRQDEAQKKNKIEGDTTPKPKLRPEPTNITSEKLKKAADVNGENLKDDNTKSPNDDKKVGLKSVVVNGKDGVSTSKQNSKQKKSSDSSKGNNPKTFIENLQLKCVDTSNRSMKKARNTYYQLCFLEFKRFVKSTTFFKGHDYGFLSAFCYCLKSKDPNILNGFNLSHINFSDEEYKEAIDFFFYLYSGKPSDSGAISHIKGLLSFCIPGGMAEKNKQDVKDLELHGEKFTEKIAKEFGISPSVSENFPKWDDWIEAIKGHLTECFKYPDNRGDASDFCRALQVDKKIRNENAHEWKGANIEPSDWPATLKFLLHSYIGLCLILIKVARTKNKDLPAALKNEQNKFEEFRKTDIFIATPNQLINSLSINDVNLNIANNSRQHTVSLSPKKYKIKWIFDNNNPYEEEVTIPEYYDVSIIITGDNAKVTYDSALTEYITGHLGDNNQEDTTEVKNSVEEIKKITEESVKKLSEIDEKLNSTPPQREDTPKGEGTPVYHIHVSGGNIGGISFGGDNTGHKVSGENTENTNSPTTPNHTSSRPRTEEVPPPTPPKVEGTKKDGSGKWLFLLLLVIIIMGLYFLLDKGTPVEQNVTVVIDNKEQVDGPKTEGEKPDDKPNPIEEKDEQEETGKSSGGGGKTTLPTPPQPEPQPEVDANYEAGMAAYNAGDGLEAIKKFNASGSAEAYYMLGVIYENGCGSIAANQMKARDNYKKAKNLGSEKAKAKL